MACCSAPLDRERPDEEARKRAVSALQRIWESLGFEHYREDAFVLNLGTVTLGERLPGLAENVEALPQPDYHQWAADLDRS